MSSPLVAIRRRRSVFVWVLLACVAVFAASVVLQRRALTQQQEQAAGRARAAATVVGAQLKGDRLTKPLDAPTTAKLQAHPPEIPIIAERVWSTAGVLRYSSLRKDASRPIMDLLKPATKGPGHVESSIEGNLMTTYMPLRAGVGAPAYGAVEIEQSYAAVVSASASPWTTVRAAAAALALLMLIAIVLGSVAGLPGRRAAKAGAGFVPRDEGPEPPPVTAEQAPARARENRAKAEAAKAEAAKAEAAKAEAAKAEAVRASEEELVKVKEQLRADHDRAVARIDELSAELERVNAKLKEAQVAATAVAAVPVPDPGLVQHAHELEQSLAEERHRSTAAETRLVELQAELEQTESRLRGSYAEIETLGAELADLRANVERLSRELGTALERAREAEDMAAEFQDRLSAAAPSGEENPLDVWAARQPNTEPVEDDTAADDLRSRLTRAAARKRGHNPNDAEWP